MSTSSPRGLAPAPPVPTWLPALFAALALACLPGLRPRLDFDRQDVTVELVADLQDFRAQAEAVGQDLDATLSALKQAGATSVAVAPISLSDLVERGLARAEPAPPGQRAWTLFPAAAPYRVPEVLGDLFPVEVEGDRLLVRAGGPLVSELRLLVAEGLTESVRAAGLGVVVRLKNAPVHARLLPHLVARVPEGATLVFDDKEALGYPASLRPVAEALAARKVAVGLVEFSGQRGVESLAALGKLPMRAVHSIPGDEMEKYPLSRVLPRWARAVNERRIRLLYLRPFPVQNLPFARETALEANLEYLRRVVTVLRAEGFVPGEARHPTQAAAPALAQVAAALAAGAALAWALSFLRILPPFLLVALTLSGCLVAALAGGLKGFGLLPNLIALAAACAAPAAAVLDLYEASARGAGWARRLAGIVGVYLASLGAGIVVFCTLSDPGYLTRAHAFRGVKLVYLGPLALVALYHLHRIDWHRRAMTLVVAGMLAGGGLGGVVYLARSGNFSPVPASSAEHRLRDSMEAALPFRPRTKEVVVGYPLLGVMAAAAAAGDPLWAGFASIAGAVAGVSASNSFCHLKTPFVASAGRGLMGLLFGIPVALLGAFLYWALLRRRDRKVWFLAGYGGQGNFGDDALTAILADEMVRRAPDDVEVLVLGTDPDAPPPAEGARWVARRDLPGILAALRHAEVFATGPGGLVQDRTSLRTPIYYLGLHALAHLVGVPRTAFLGEGFGPLSSGAARAALRFYAARATTCLVRDGDSEALVAPHAQRGPDLFVLSRPWSASAPDKRTLGLCLRPMPGGAICFALPLARALANAGAEAGLERVRLLVAHPAQDGPLAKKVARALEKEGVEVAIATMAHGEVEEATRDLTAVAAMRLHVCHLAVQQGVPLLALPYDPKVERFLEEAAWPHRASPQEDPVLAARQLGKMLAEPREARDRIVEARRRLRERVPQALAALDRLFGPRREPISFDRATHERTTATSDAALS